MIQRANFRHLYADIFWYGVLAGSTIAFVAIYATRQGASSLQVSLLTSRPGLINLLFSMPAGRWLENQRLLPATYGSAFWQRVGYLALIPLPWLLSPKVEVWVIVMISLVMFIPGTILAISFNALFAEVVPGELRGAVIGRRWAIQSFGMAATSLLCGQILSRAVFPLNYQLVFGVGGAAALMSTYHISRLRVLSDSAPHLAATNPFQLNNLKRLLANVFMANDLLPRLYSMLRIDLLRGAFGPFITTYFFFYFVQYVPVPLFPLFSVRVIDLQDDEISLANALFYGFMLLGSILVGRLSRKFSPRTILVTGGLLIFLLPLLYALAQDVKLVLVAACLGGAIWAFVNTGTINRLMEKVPENDRPAHMALHNVALNLGMLVGALCGTLLAEWLGLREAMFTAVVLRVIASVLLVLFA